MQITKTETFMGQAIELDFTGSGWFTAQPQTWIRVAPNKWLRAEYDVLGNEEVAALEQAYQEYLQRDQGCS